MATRLIMAVVLLAALAAPLGAAPISSAQETPSASSACDQTARHDAFMTESAAVELNETGSTTSAVSNTRVVLEDAPAFVRVRADNPNGYCVAYVVEISPDIVPAADLGGVESNDERLEASWRAVQNLSSGTVRTQVEFTLGPGESATFAPSTVRVRSLSWTGEAKRTGTSVVSAVRDLWGSSVLEKRKYEIESTESSSSITIPLEDGKGREVEEWIASYELDGDRRAVSQDASAPVYYTESASSVTFHFNDKGAAVTFIAEPNTADKLSHSASSYWSGINDLERWLPLDVATSRAGGTQS